jgi:hypothetical protein
MPGYPDFQAFANRRTANLLSSLSQTLATGEHDTDVMAVASYSGLQIRVVPSAGYASVSVIWYLDAAGTQILSSDAWPVNSFTGLSAIYPVFAPFMKFSVNVTSAEDLVAATFIAGLAIGPERPIYPVGSQTVKATARTLAASGSDYYHPSRICRGTGFFTFRPYDTAGKLDVSIQTFTEAGVFVAKVAVFGTPTAIVNQQIQLPDTNWNVAVVNNDTGAGHKYDMGLVVPN